MRAMTRRGFSLAELAMVAMVITIIGALAAPRVASALARQRVDSAARRVAADIALAQRTARAASAARTVTFDVANDQYTLDEVPDPDRPSRDYVVELNSEPYTAQLMQAAFGDEAELVFDGFGKVTSAGKVVLRVGRHCREVAINAEGSSGITTVACPSGKVVPIEITGTQIE